MKIKKMQQGSGLIYTPFIPQAQASAESSSRSNTSSEESKIDALDKELIGLMKGQDLLPSDIDRIAKSIINFQKRASQYTALGDYSFAMPGMYQIQSEIAKAQFYKKQSDAATKRMADENAGSEVALDNYGRMYVQDKDGNVTKVSTSEFDPEKYAPLSNSQLLYYRQVGGTDNGQIFLDLNNTIGMETVQKQITDIINNFGTIKGDRFETRKMQSIAEDLSAGVFKITEKYSKADLNDFSGLLLSQLSRDARYRVKANAEIAGMNEKDYITAIIKSRTDVESSTSFEASMTKAINGDSGDGSGSSSTSGGGKTVKDTYAERLTTGDGLGPMHTIKMMTKNSGNVFNIQGQDARYVLKDKRAMENSNLERVLTQADAIGSIVDSNAITFGDQLLDTRQLTNLMIDNKTPMERVWLPIKYSPDGRVTPDWDAYKKLQQIQDFVDSKNGAVLDATIESWLAENLPNAKWDSMNKRVVFNSADMLPFLMLHGIAASNRLDFDEDSDFLVHLDSSEGRGWKEDYERIVTEYVVDGKIEHKKAKGARAGKYYSGNVFLPITNPLAGTMIYNDQYFPQDVYTNTTQKAENNEARRQMITNFD